MFPTSRAFPRDSQVVTFVEHEPHKKPIMVLETSSPTPYLSEVHEDLGLALLFSVPPLDHTVVQCSSCRAQPSSFFFFPF